MNRTISTTINNNNIRDHSNISKLKTKKSRIVSRFKSSIKKSKYQNHRSDDNNIQTLRNLLLNTTNIDNIIQGLNDFYLNNINYKKYENYKNQFVSIKLGGKSGAALGYLSKQKNIIMKMNFIKKNQQIVKLDKHRKCIFINNKFNEILINFIFKNIEAFTNISKSEKEYLQNHILEIDDYGFTQKTLYITTPLVGFNYNDSITKKNKYITNMNELLVNNHIPALKKILKDDNTDLINLYDHLLSTKLKEYFETLKIAQNYLHFINNDTKLNNVFVKYQKNDDKSLTPLINQGLITDFVPLLSDLEKSLIEINGHKIITYSNSPIKSKILHSLDIGLIYNVRYECESGFNKICQKLSIYDFDILLLTTDLYILLLGLSKNIFEYLPRTNKLVMEVLNLEQDKFDIYKKLLVLGNYKIGIGGSFHLGEIIKKYCKLLNKETKVKVN
jgi:hypothetical protein